MNKIVKLWSKFRGGDNEFYMEETEGEEAPQRRDS